MASMEAPLSVAMLGINTFLVGLFFGGGGWWGAILHPILLEQK